MSYVLRHDLRTTGCAWPTNRRAGTAYQAVRQRLVWAATVGHNTRHGRNGSRYRTRTPDGPGQDRRLSPTDRTLLPAGGRVHPQARAATGSRGRPRAGNVPGGVSGAQGWTAADAHFE